MSYRKIRVIFLTLVEIDSVEDRGIYQDLLRKFRDEGHDVTVVTPVQRYREIETNLTEKEGVALLQVKTLNIQKTNIIEKGIGTLALAHQYRDAIKKYVPDRKFDLILYSTPPITLVRVIDFLKKRDGAFAYLLLKDIFPQNAIDMKMMMRGGLIHRYFLRREKELYHISDAIGCMSQANVGYILRHHPEVAPGKVEVNPNSVEPQFADYSLTQKNDIRRKYGLPVDKRILVYGGNLGRPQGLGFLLETITAVKNKKAFFLIVGDGTEYDRIDQWFNSHQPQNAVLLRKLPKEDYDVLLSSCDIGLIFLDKNFRIPNFPSRLLSYLEMQKPVISATDPNTDIGDIIAEHGCGYKVLAGDRDGMVHAVNKLVHADLTAYQVNCRMLLEREYPVSRSFMLIMNRVQNG